MTVNNFIYPSQLSSLKFKLTIDADVTLTYIIQTGWVKNLSTSTLTFDITQFFPSLNYWLLSLIIKKTGVRRGSYQGGSPQNGLGDEQTLWNDLGFSLCAAPSVCCMVATSDKGEEIRVEVSTDWCVAVEHWRLSSIRDYLRRLSD